MEDKDIGFLRDLKHTLTNRRYLKTLNNILKPLKEKSLVDDSLKEIYFNLYNVFSEVQEFQSDLIMTINKILDPVNFGDMIRRSRPSIFRKDENTIDLIEILETSLSKITNSLLKSPEYFWKEKRSEFIEKDFSKLINTFQKDVIFDESSVLRWFKNNIVKIDITESNSWRDLKLVKDGYGYLLLKKYFDEILLNYFKYGNTKDIEIHFTEDECFLYFLWKNQKMFNSSSGTNIGLKSINNDLQMLNCINEDCLLINQNDQIFEIKLKFKRDLLI